MNIPNFFVVGAAKAGTSSLSYYLRQHPEIYVSPIKEPHYFSEDICEADFKPEYRQSVALDLQDYFRKSPLSQKHIAHIRGQAHYLALFREVGSEKAIGELSTGYLYSACAAENLFRFNPQAKIIIVLRQPVERAYSHYLMDLRGSWDLDSSFLSAIEQDFAEKEKGWGKTHLYIELGLYSAQVRRYLDRFPENQVKIALYDDLVADSVGFMEGIYQFLEVDPALSNTIDFTKREGVASLPRLKIKNDYLPIANRLRHFLSHLIPHKIQRQAKQWIYTNKAVPRLTQAEFERVLPYFQTDIQKLSALIKRDLSNWYFPRQ
jgi:hypothetical protein